MEGGIFTPRGNLLEEGNNCRRIYRKLLKTKRMDALRRSMAA